MWADEKKYVARENREMTPKAFEALFENEDPKLLLKMYRTR